MASRESDIFTDLILHESIHPKLLDEMMSMGLDLNSFERKHEEDAHRANEKILRAIEDNRLEVLIERLKASKKEGERLWGKDKEHNPLNVAIKHGNVEAVKILLRFGCLIPKSFFDRITEQRYSIIDSSISLVFRNAKAQKMDEATQFVEAAAELLDIAERNTTGILNLLNGKNLTSAFGKVATSENGFANERRWFSFKNQFLHLIGINPMKFFWRIKRLHYR